MNQDKMMNKLQELRLSISDHVDIKETTDELTELIKDYNFKMIDKGLSVKRSQLRKNNTIDVQNICEYNDDNDWILPRIPLIEYEMDSIIYDMPNKWHYLIPCFKTGIIQLNKARYIYFNVIDTNTENKSVTIEINDYIRDESIWQRGVCETITYCLKDFDANKFNKDMSIECTKILINAKNDEDANRTNIMIKIHLTVLGNFIHKVATGENQMTYADIYQLLSQDDLHWSDNKYDLWKNIILDYSKKYLDLTEKEHSFDSLRIWFTSFIIISNLIIDREKYHPEEIKEEYIDAKGDTPAKIITTMGGIKFISKEPVKMIKDETITKQQVIPAKPTEEVITPPNIPHTFDIKDSIMRRKSVTKIIKKH